ncbi:MAG: LysE family translocator [Gammaproteobacteria bacterium]|nr:LysE family translocator [Gammaproteobacteria bacterium]
MAQKIMPLDVWLLYMPLVLSVTLLPGPSTLLVINHRLQYGTNSAVAAASGNAVGVLAVCWITTLGLVMASAVSDDFLRGVRFAGGGFLLIFGVAICTNPRGRTQILNTRDPQTGFRSFFEGLLLGVANPVIFSFTIGIFPLFLDTASPEPMRQLAALALTFAGLSFTCLVMYAVCAEVVLRGHQPVQGQAARITRSLVFTIVGLSVSLAALEGNF